MDSRRHLSVLATVVAWLALCTPSFGASHVYVVNNGGDNVSQYDVGPGGVLSPKTPTAVTTGSDPYAIAISPDGRSAYVASYNDPAVWQYDIGPGGGLTPKSPASVPSASRYVRVRGSFTHKDSAGANQLKFRGRLRGHKLSPGRYRLVATPRDRAGNVGKPARHGFRILRGP